MATCETRRQRGHRAGEELLRRLATEIRTARLSANMSQRALARHVGWSQSELSRFERNRYSDFPIVRLSEIAAVLGLDLVAGLRPGGSPLRDSGHQRLIGRFLQVLSSSWMVSREVLLPNLGDRRAWDVLLRLGSQLVGVEAETRVRDVQALVRRVRERERDGGTDQVLLVLADTVHNRALVDELREALGARFQTPSRPLVAALRSGSPLPGSGVILV